MSLANTQISSLLGVGASRPVNVNQLITGESTNLVRDVLGASAASTAPSLTSKQQSSISSLNEYVDNNLTGEAADKLKASIAGLEKLLSVGNDVDNAQLDPVFSLLASNPSILGGQVGDTGQILDQLL